MGRYRIGIDLGGTNIAAGILDDSLSLIAKASVPTKAPRPAEEVCRDMADLCRRLCREAGGLSPEEDILSVGIGSPGIISGGVVLRADNLGFRNAPLVLLMSRLLGKPVTLRNDGNAAAYGELVAGCGQGCRSLVAVTLGTGVGGGIVLDGRILEGCAGGAGEVGHIITHAGGRRCACGKRGCLEAYCSATALIGSTIRAMENNPDSLLWEAARSTSLVNGKTAFDAMRLGDPVASAVVEEFILDLATGVSNLINLLQPEILCIGGGISREGETLLAPLRAKTAGLLCAPENSATRIVAASLGNDAGIIGAAAAGGLNAGDARHGDTMQGGFL